MYKTQKFEKQNTFPVILFIMQFRPFFALTPKSYTLSVYHKKKNERRR